MMTMTYLSNGEDSMLKFYLADLISKRLHRPPSVAHLEIAEKLLQLANDKHHMKETSV